MLRREGMDGCIEFKNVEVTRTFFWCLVLECGYELPAKLARKSFHPWRWRLIKWRNCSEKWKEWKLIPSAEVNETRYREQVIAKKKTGKQHALEMPNERDSPLSANGDEELRLTGNGDSESNNESDYNTRYENRQQGVTVSSIIDRLRIGSEWYRGEII